MGTKIAVIIFIIILVLFFLSIFAPLKSEKKFWIIIHKIRAVMDMISYWFINICGMVYITFLAGVVIWGLFKIYSGG